MLQSPVQMLWYDLPLQNHGLAIVSCDFMADMRPDGVMVTLNELVFSLK
jgi:hypothetical protein